VSSRRKPPPDQAIPDQKPSVRPRSRKSEARSDPRDRKPGKGGEFLFLISIFAFLFVAIALAGYSPRSDSDWLGRAGAWVASGVSLYTFGRWGALAIPVAWFLILLKRLSGDSFRPARWVAMVLICGFFTGFGFAFIRAWLHCVPDFVFSGIVPNELARISEAYLRRGGTILAASAIVLSSGVLLLDIKLTGVFQALFYSIPIAIWSGLVGFFRPIFSPHSRPRIDETDELDPDEEEYEKEEPGRGRGVRGYDVEPESEIEPGLEEEEEERDGNLQGEAVTSDASGEREFPPLKLLDNPPDDRPEIDAEELEDNARRLEDKLGSLGITAQVLKTNPGPIITRYDLEPAADVKMARIASLSDDIAMALRAKGVRILAPIPGEAAVGIEIPNRAAQAVYIREVIGSDEFRNAEAPLTMALGQDTSGNIFCADLARMPHLLIAGATGSGKSVCINIIITSLLYRCDPSEVRLVLVDPKKIELSQYAKLAQQHLLTPPGMGELVITTPENAIKALHSIHLEMERRYEIMADAGVRGLDEYNEWIDAGTPGMPDPGVEPPQRLPYIVVIIDELADLMMSGKREFEELVVRLAQMARAVGIHLIVATQRPSVDVVTGLIKANFPARIAFKVAQKVDSRTIIDAIGAEALLGNGDMLFIGPGTHTPVRVHGAMITTAEVARVVEFIQAQPPFSSHFVLPDPELARSKSAAYNGKRDDSDRDELFVEAARIVVHTEQGSVSVLQRRLRVGYARAARLIDELERAGVVGSFDGSKARQVLMTPEELRETLGIE